ncbi:methylated-DNA--[protein]-cysteine S-methyltransferase [Lyngbya confervoides]|uniref:Methylated-DNA--protein-cysteine methyltransferase n=1 Tax=Lyngbya confervoides BDU141951 TaxID=1574623 RepID=A0ABD4T4B7_9CYAN|nr:methylated-DNA--[protein]-cysteine S-methyltransferase [Lyngbya confervoides]MCM1983538.1 methylated-DNA--[protein]-cysteine S-methyltransferase [Lyngbya confervoides BDU141951]
MIDLFIDSTPSPLGIIDIVADASRLLSVDFQDCRPRLHRLLTKRYGPVSLIPRPHLLQARDRLKAYFSGELDALQGIAIDPGGSVFQRQVWGSLSTIQPGSTRTYGDLAQQIHRPGAAQAVGRANALNPVLIFLPCHRVVGRDQTLVGYAAGLQRKQWLLAHETGSLFGRI